MKYKEFKDKIKLSRLGMGNMRLPVHADKEGQPIDYEKGQAIIDAAMEAGINYYDTAYIYHNGESEVFVGKALAKYPRDSYYVADKFNFQAQPDYEVQFAEQLKRLSMDRIDFYLLHGIQDNFVDEILASGCVEYFKKKKAEGKIRYFGFSFHGCKESLQKMLAYSDWDFVQIQLNYYDWEYGNQRALYEILEAAGIPVMIMEPVRGGMLARLNEEASSLLNNAEPGASAASWALRWVKGLPAVQVVLSGMGDTQMMEDNVRTFSDLPDLNEDEKSLVKRAAELLRKNVTMPCTACRYCVPNCPMELDIPSLLIAYNDFKNDGPWRLENLRGWEAERQPSACIGCGACTAHCPQSLAVPDAMSEMAEVLA